MQILAEVKKAAQRHLSVDDVLNDTNFLRHYRTIEGNCAQEDCRIIFTVNHPLERIAGPIMWAAYDSWKDGYRMREPFELLSTFKLRLFHFRASFAARHKLVKAIGVQFAVPTPEGSWIDADAGTASQALSSPNPMGFFDEHPNYWVEHPVLTTPGSGTAISARFTPLANEQERARALNVNLHCISSFRPCRSTTDVLPTAELQYHYRVPQTHECSPIALWRIARDSNEVFLARIISKPGTQDSINIQVLEVLKGHESELSTLNQLPIDPRMRWRKLDVPQSNLLIVFLEIKGIDIPSPTCGVVEGSSANQEAVRRSIRENAFDLPFGYQY